VRLIAVRIDYQISCSYDIEVSFPHNTATYVSYPASLGTPLIYSLVNFQSIHEKIGIAVETAKILDDSRYLTMAVLKHLENVEIDESRPKLSSIADMIQNRISKLPTGAELDSKVYNDNIYKSCRTAALIYTRAVLGHMPLSQACTMVDLQQLWSSMWRVTLKQWKLIPGIFLWVIVSALQAAQATPHGRFLKSMFKAASSYMAMEHFEVVDASLMNVVKVQRWLRASQTMKTVKDSIGSGKRLDYLHNYR
jgi:hypothetical protein